jgi:hypothetical protein
VLRRAPQAAREIIRGWAVYVGEPSALAAEERAVPVEAPAGSVPGSTSTVLIPLGALPPTDRTRVATPSAAPTHSGSVPARVPVSPSSSTSRVFQPDQAPLLRVRTWAVTAPVPVPRSQVTPSIPKSFVRRDGSSASTFCASSGLPSPVTARRAAGATGTATEDAVDARCSGVRWAAVAGAAASGVRAWAPTGPRTTIVAAIEAPLSAVRRREGDGWGIETSDPGSAMVGSG